MNSEKVFSVLAAVMMVAVVGAVVFTSEYSDADDTPVSNGTMTVNILTSVNGNWVTDTVAAYDGALALSRALANHQWSNDVDTTMYSYPTQYVEIDYSYGAFTTINGITNSGSSTWHTYYFNENDGWVPVTCTLGWYKPFGDYDINHRTANIAVVYGTDSAVSNIMENNAPDVVAEIVSVNDIVGNNNFKVSFYIKVESSAYAMLVSQGKSINVTGSNVTVQQVLDGVYVSGYGSDFYLALKNAFGTLVNGQEVVPYYDNGDYYTIYGWLNSFLGISSVWMNDGADSSDPYDDVWAWWQEYYYYSVDPNTGNAVGTTSDFAIGLLSPLADAPLTHSTFALYFAAGTM